MSRLVLALALALALPLVARAAPATDDAYVFASPQAAGSIFVEVHYGDGLASTKFSFFQLTGATGGPTQRLKPTPECTEWIGTFDSAILEANANDHVANSTVRLFGYTASTGGAGRYDDVPFNFTAATTLGGMSGSLLICDQPGDGLARYTLSPSPTLSLAATPLTVRMQLEASP
jgi:hypothetical protein